MSSVSQLNLGSSSMSLEQAFSNKIPMSFPFAHSCPFSLKSFFPFQQIKAGATLCKPWKRLWKYLQIMCCLQISQHKYLPEADSTLQPKRRTEVSLKLDGGTSLEIYLFVWGLVNNMQPERPQFRTPCSLCAAKGGLDWFRSLCPTSPGHVLPSHLHTCSSLSELPFPGCPLGDSFFVL